MEYNFIIPDRLGVPIEVFRQGTHADFVHLYDKGEYCWALQTYHLLKARGFPVSLSFLHQPDRVNLAHGNTLRALSARGAFFTVSLQADFPHYPLAQFHVVQNQHQVTTNSCFVPHWPQSQFVHRAPARQGVSVVAYQGLAEFTDLDCARLNADLQSHGICFEMRGPTRWGDLSEVDVLVGIRHFGTQHYNRKPASKLINAWRAGIPFIGGWDSAFSQLGTPGKDYLRVQSYDQLIATILQLKDNNLYYNQLVDAGLTQAHNFTFESIASCWETLLETAVAPCYAAWKSAPPSRFSSEVRVAQYFISSALKSALRPLSRVPLLKKLRALVRPV